MLRRHIRPQREKTEVIESVVDGQQSLFSDDELAQLQDPNVSITDLSKKYNITVEAQGRINPGITTAIVGKLPFSEFKYEDFVEIMMALQKEWDVPILTHAFPKDKLFNLRQKYGSKIIRDDIVRKS